MYYEIYLDSLFLLQFFMNLYLLGLVNHALYQAASWKRIVVGALLGAICSLVPFLLPVKLLYSMISGFLLSIVCMSLYTFRVFQCRQLWGILEKMLLMTLLLGSILLFLLKILPKTEGAFWGLVGVLALGAVSYVVARRLTGNKDREGRQCRVLLEGEKGSIWLNALMDTGNSLVEPISGRPVIVLAESAFRELYEGGKPELYRVIPYRSVGTRSGILEGYLLNSMIVEQQGVKKECRHIYAAVSQELVSDNTDYQVILNPRMLQE